MRIYPRVICLMVGITASFVGGQYLGHLSDEFLSRPVFAAEAQQNPSPPEQKPQEPHLSDETPPLPRGAPL